MLEYKRKLGKKKLKPTGPREKQFKDDDTIRVSVIIKGTDLDIAH